MTKRLLVGVSEAAEMAALLPDLRELLGRLGALGVETQVVVVADRATAADGPTDLDCSVEAELSTVADILRLRALCPDSRGARLQAVISRVDPDTAARFQDLRTLGERRRIRPPDCIHLHGVRAAPLLDWVRSARAPVTVYLPPSDGDIATLSLDERRELMARADRFLVADESAVAPLLGVGVDSGRIAPAGDLASLVPSRPASDRVRARARSASELPVDRPVVAVLPVPDWAELPDLTLALAWEMAQLSGSRPPILWWLGMPADDDPRWPLIFDIDRMGLENVRLASRVPSWEEVLGVADAVVFPADGAGALPPGFARTAARRAVPLWCWDGHSRAAELARWGGTVVEGGDVETLAAMVHDAVATPAGRRRARAAVWRLAMAEAERLLPLGVPLP